MKQYLSVFLCLSVIACAPSHMTLKPEYSDEIRVDENSTKEFINKNTGKHCLLINDLRQDQSNGLITIKKEVALEWLTSAINIETQGNVSATNKDNVELPIINIRKLYVKYLPMVIKGTTVLSYENKGQVKIFRGVNTKSNWAGTQKEHQQVISRSLQNALVKMFADININEVPMCL